MKRHNLKILPRYFEAQIAGLKPFEIRRHDRDFTVGDEIKLSETDGKIGADYRPTGRSCLVRIKYILRSDYGNEFEGIEPGFSILGTELIYSP